MVLAGEFSGIWQSWCCAFANGWIWIKVGAILLKHRKKRHNLVTLLIKHPLGDYKIGYCTDTRIPGRFSFLRNKWDDYYYYHYYHYYDDDECWSFSHHHLCLKRLHKLSPPHPIWVECLLPCGVQLPLEWMFSLLYKWSCIVAPSGGGMEQK